MDNQIILIDEAAAYLKVKPTFLRRLCNNKDGLVHPKWFRIANKFAFRKEDLDNWVNFHEGLEACNTRKKVPAALAE